MNEKDLMGETPRQSKCQNPAEYAGYFRERPLYVCYLHEQYTRKVNRPWIWPGVECEWIMPIPLRRPNVFDLDPPSKGVTK